MTVEPILTADQRAFLASARRAVLATIDPAGRPRLVPVCFVVEADAPVLWTPLDEKPKATDDPHALARVRDILARPTVSLLVDRWDEDWTRLAWLRAYGRAALAEPESAGRVAAIEALRERYPQYETHGLEWRPLIRVSLERVTSWGDLDPA
jgi:PPOX class probable F420-dependent enzyme